MTFSSSVCLSVCCSLCKSDLFQSIKKNNLDNVTALYRAAFSRKLDACLKKKKVNKKNFNGQGG